MPLTRCHARENLPGRAAKRQSYVPSHQRRDARARPASAGMCGHSCTLEAGALTLAECFHRGWNVRTD